MPASALAGDALFEAVVAETHDIAADIVVVASAMNAPLAQAGHVLRACRNFLPRQGSGTQWRVGARDEADLLARAVGRLGGMLDSVRNVARPTEALVAAAEAVVPAHELARLHAPCARGWRAIAVRALDLIEMLEPETRWRLSGAYTENSLILARALRAVVAGETAAMDHWGELARPALPQRRVAPRYARDESCIVHSAGRAVRARMLDISAGGVGVTSVPHVALRDRVVVETRGGRRLLGTVVWTRHTRIGVQFDTLLGVDDPLL